MRWARRLAAGVALTAMASAHGANDLLEVWQEAQRRDPAYRLSQVDQTIAAKRQDQSSALWNPTVFLNLFGGVGGSDASTRGAQFYSSDLGAGRYEGSTFNTSVLLGASGRAAITAIKPLFDRERETQARQLGMAGEVSDAAHELARQFLARSVVERYLDVLMAQELLRLNTEQEKSILRADEELRRRRGLGDVSLIDVRESGERLDQLRAARVGLASDLEVAAQTLAEFSGVWPTLRPPIFVRGFPKMAGQTPEALISELRARHPQLRLLDTQYRIAVHERDRYLLGQQGAKVNLLGQAGYDHLEGAGAFGIGSSRVAQYLVGVQVNIPLSTGGLSESRAQEASLSAERIKTERERAALDLEREARAAWSRLGAVPARLEALERSLVSSRLRLAETRKAHGVGARTTQELLMAEAAAIDAERMLFIERIGQARSRTRLAAASGMLSEQVLSEINEFLHQP